MSAEKDKFEVLNVTYNNITTACCLESISQFLKDDKKRQIYFLNAHCLQISQNHSIYLQALQNAAFLLPDGIGIKLITRLYGGRLKENLNGTDLSPLILKMIALNGYSVFFLGGKSGVAKKAAENAIKLFPNLKIAGHASGYFNNDATVINQINTSGAQILFVALGVPKQETWINTHSNEIDAKLCLGVGAYLDYLSDTIPRAPLWMRKLNLEWFWRIFIEPKRMFQRYIIDGSLFMISVIFKRLFSKKHRS